MKQRIEYLDAMRGFAMILVVTGHVCLMCTGIPLTGVIRAFINLELPIFFTISGFFCYKTRDYLSNRQICKFLYNKFILFVISPLFFIALWIWLTDCSFQTVLYDQYKKGYWFTFTLFQCILIYILIKKSLTLFKVNSLIESGIFLLSGLMLYALATLLTGKIHDYRWITLFGLNHMQYYLYFVYGILMKKHFDVVEKCFKSQLFLTLLIIVFFVGNMYSFFGTNFRYIGPSNVLYFLLLTSSGVFLTFAVFHNFKISGKSLMGGGKFLSICGLYSLEIYYTHYFILPRNLKFIGDFISEYPNYILAFVIALSIAIFVILVSVGISKIISMSPLLAQILFGKKIQRAEIANQN